MDFWLTRLCIQKALAFVYVIAFLIIVNQYKGLLGQKGILPATRFVKFVRFWDAPSLFWFYSSDRLLTIMGWLGLLLSLFALSGQSESYGLALSMTVWFLLWAIYQSFVNVGQTFYSFGWEILLLETGFLAIFLGPANELPPVAVIYLFRWLLFRVMFGAGLIKLRCDPGWKDLTSMMFYYETQPLPGPLSRYLHYMPKWIHKFAVLVNHFIELIVPFCLFWPAPLAVAGGLLTAFFQFMLIVSGNLSWLNYITLVLCISCFNDDFLSSFIHLSPPEMTASLTLQLLSYCLALVVIILSIKPVRNLLSKHQTMNRSYDPLNLVNTYGAFGSITRIRMEIIIEGTSDTTITPETEWIAYEFRGKPGATNRRPPQVSPYHHKIDWQMWFAAMSDHRQHPWFLPFIKKLLEGNKPVTRLLRTNPFPDKPPHFIRASYYEYHFSPLRPRLLPPRPSELAAIVNSCASLLHKVFPPCRRRSTWISQSRLHSERQLGSNLSLSEKATWQRTKRSEYLAPLSLDNFKS